MKDKEIKVIVKSSHDLTEEEYLEQLLEAEAYLNGKAGTKLRFHFEMIPPDDTNVYDSPAQLNV